MQGSLAFSPAVKLIITGLVVAAIGIVIQILSGVDYPTVPPGLFILLIPAALIAVGRWRWALIVGTLAGLFILVGFFASGSVEQLLDLDRLGVSIGTGLQFVALLVTVVAGIVGTLQSYRSRTASTLR